MNLLFIASGTCYRVPVLVGGDWSYCLRIKLVSLICCRVGNLNLVC